jgi:hypothetical protein
MHPKKILMTIKEDRAWPLLKKEGSSPELTPMAVNFTMGALYM